MMFLIKTKKKSIEVAESTELLHYKTHKMISIISNQVVVGVVVVFTTSAIYHSRKANGNLCLDPKLSAWVLGVNHGSAQKNNQFRIHHASNIRGYQH